MNDLQLPSGASVEFTAAAREYNNAVNAFGQWYQVEKERVHEDVPDTTDHLLGGIRLLLPILQKVAVLTKLHETELHTAFVKERRLAEDENHSAALSELKQEQGKHAQAASAHTQAQFHLGAEFDKLTQRYWNQYPARSATGAGYVQIVKQ